MRRRERDYESNSHRSARLLSVRYVAVALQAVCGVCWNILMRHTPKAKTTFGITVIQASKAT